MRSRGCPGPQRRSIRLSRTFARAFALLPLVLLPHRVATQDLGGGRVPFFVGERLEYSVRVKRLLSSGRGAMWVEGPVDVRGTSTYLLRFDSRVRLGPFTGEGHTSSWLDPLRMASLRFEKHERSPLSRQRDSVELLPSQRRWEAAGGRSGETASDAPLDELSFIYYLRTLALEPETELQFNRHFDAARNPTVVRIMRRETIAVRAGEFRTVLVEMRVKDPRWDGDGGRIRINITDDACRLPVRIETAMPGIGSAVFTLDSHTHPAAHCAGLVVAQSQRAAQQR